MNIQPRDTKTFTLNELIDKLGTLKTLLGVGGMPTDVKSIEVEDDRVYFKTE